MIKNKVILFIIFSLIICTCCNLNNNHTVHAEDGDSQIVMEVSTNRVLYEKNAHERRPIASLTKIITAIVVIESFPLDKEITITEKTCGVEGSSIYLKPGEVFTASDLLYGLMLRSGNDCAETLAVAVSGSKEKFVTEMNSFVKSLGANNTSLVNPHGLHDDNHYSTAYDMAIIASYCMKNPIFSKIVNTKSIYITEKSTGEKRLLNNKNKLLFNYENCTGIKTGYTKKAGRCLASSATHNGLSAVSIVLGCPDMYNVSQVNFESTFSNYRMTNLCDENTFEYILMLNGSKGNCIGRVNSSFSYPLKNGEEKAVRTVIIKDNNLKLPLKKGDKIANMQIYLENQLIFSQNIYTIIDVDKKFDIFEPIKNWAI